MAPPLRSRLIALSRIAVSCALLAGLWSIVDGRAVVGRLATLELFWVAIALLLSVPQHLLSAWRWRFTAGRLGARLGYRRAVADYYLASLVNQIVPGGVTGDLLRAWRHGRQLRTELAQRSGPAVRAVIFERLSGQAVLLVFVAAGLAVWPFSDAMPVDPGGLLALAVACVAGTLTLGWLVRRDRAAGRALAGFLSEAHAALTARGAILPQLGSSSLIVLSYVATYACAAQALGLIVEPLAFLALAPMVLLSMSLPLSVAGWGLREATAAALWAAAGLPAADGVTISVAYGLLVLLASLPGALVVFGGSMARGRPR